jgi:hypothetical protein
LRTTQPQHKKWQRIAVYAVKWIAPNTVKGAIGPRVAETKITYLFPFSPHVIVTTIRRYLLKTQLNHSVDAPHLRDVRVGV